MHIRFAICLALLATPAAAWEVTRERDRMSDKTFTWARATSGDATLLVGCMNGHPSPRLTWSNRKGWGSGVGVTWRVDDGPVDGHLAGLFTESGTVLHPWVSTAGEMVAALRKAKRLRVELGRDFYDFDLTKGDRLPTIRCD